MPAMSIVLDVELDGFRALSGFANAAEAVDAGRLVHLGEDARLEIGALASGMKSGAPSVALCFKLPDGTIVLAETSLALFLTAAEVLAARYGDPRS